MLHICIVIPYLVTQWISAQEISFCTLQPPCGTCSNANITDQALGIKFFAKYHMMGANGAVIVGYMIHKLSPKAHAAYVCWLIFPTDFQCKNYKTQDVPELVKTCSLVDEGNYS